MLPFGSSIFYMCRLLCCGCQMQKDQILLNPEEPPCTLLQSTSEPPEMGWRWAVPKAECSTGWWQKGDGCSSLEFIVKLADVCVTAEDQPWKQEQKGERQSWCIISVTAEVHGWALWEKGPQPRRWNSGWDKIYVIISSFTARKLITTTVLLE